MQPSQVCFFILSIYSMFLWAVLLAVLFSSAAVTLSVPIQKSNPVTLNSHCLHIKQNAKQNKSPILLIHGLGSSLKDWRGVGEVLALQTGRRVCAVDLRNHGDSPRSEDFNIEVMNTDIENFLNQEKIQKVNIVGHSLGGKIGVHYTLKNPNKVESLVVEDMRPNGITQKALVSVVSFLTLIETAINAIPEGSSEDEARKAILDFVNEKLQKMGSADVVDDKLADIIPIRLVNGKWEWTANIDLIKKIAENPMEFLQNSAGIYKGPALFIYGGKSPFDVAGDEENIMKLFPNAKVIPIEGAGHIIHLQFKQFSDEIIKMLNKIN